MMNEQDLEEDFIMELITLVEEAFVWTDEL
jgi:hypothetical protein